MDNLNDWYATLNYQPLDKSTTVGFDRIGISADFKTAFGTNEPVKGTYGLFLIIKTEIEEDTGVAGEDRYQKINKYIPIVFDTRRMWGNPYSFNGYFTQSICYDIQPDKQGTPIGIAGYFYQDFEFIDVQGNSIPYGYEDIYDNLTPHAFNFSEPNIFVRNINVSFGYSIDNADDDTIYLFTSNSDSYIVDNHDYDKVLQVRFIYVGDDDTRIAINSEKDLYDYTIGDKKIQALADLQPRIRWYRYELKEGTKDPRAGAFWKEIQPDE